MADAPPFKVALSLSPEVYARAIQLAAAEQIPLDEFIARALEAKLAAENPSLPSKPARVTTRDYGAFIIIGPEDE